MYGHQEVPLKYPGGRASASAFLFSSNLETLTEHREPKDLSSSLSELSPLKCAVTSKYRVLPGFGRNCPPVSGLECALTKSTSATPLECALTKKGGGGSRRLFRPSTCKLPASSLQICPFGINHLQVAPLATLLFSHSCIVALGWLGFPLPFSLSHTSFTPKQHVFLGVRLSASLCELCVSALSLSRFFPAHRGIRFSRLATRHSPLSLSRANLEAAFHAVEGANSLP
jgi:hypothetical protein